MEAIKVKYDTPIEVTEKQYKTSMNELSGVVAGKIEDGKFYLKLWIMTYSKELKQILSQ